MSGGRRFREDCLVIAADLSQPPFVVSPSRRRRVSAKDMKLNPSRPPPPSINVELVMHLQRLPPKPAFISFCTWTLTPPVKHAENEIIRATHSPMYFLLSHTPA